MIDPDHYRLTESEEAALNVVSITQLARSYGAACSREGYARAATKQPFPSERAWEALARAEKEAAYFYNLIDRVVGAEVYGKMDASMQSTRNMMHAFCAGNAMGHADNGNVEAAEQIAELGQVFGDEESAG